MAREESEAVDTYRSQVREYWDTTTALYLEHVGNTFQSARWPGIPARDSDGTLNRYLAIAAGIQPGQRVLDAGCGVCGPSIDIARAIPNVTIEAITLSPVQAEAARERVRQAGLAQRITVHLGDFHLLPFASDSFDVALFLESACYSYDQERLFGEARRVLRAGGSIFIKDIFKCERACSEEEEAQFAKMKELYASRSGDVATVIAALAAAGFTAIASQSLEEVLSFAPSFHSFYTVHSGLPLLNDFGRRHYQRLKELPVYAAAVSARA